MKNRVKNYGRNYSSLDDLLKDIQTRQEHLLDNAYPFDEAKALCSRESDERIPDALKLMSFKKHYIDNHRSILETRPPLDKLFEVLQALDRLVNSKPDDTFHLVFKILYELQFEAELVELGNGTRNFSDEQMSYREELFNRRNELPKENTARRIFVECYIDEEVFNRFYLEKEKKAKRYETEDEGENFTPEGAKEWDAHFNDLCKEYDEETYKRKYTSPEAFYPNITRKDKLYSMFVDNWTVDQKKKIEKSFKDLDKAIAKEKGTTP